MKFFFLIIYFYFFIFFNTLYAQSIAIINIQTIIDNNNQYIDIVKKIEIDQEIYLENFKNKEINLKKKFEDIENSKLILGEEELNLQIENYNQELTNFTVEVEEFNLHYQNEIINIREDILNEIIILLEKFAIENQLDLILDSTSYLIASNSLDITDKINNELENIKIKLEYTNFEKN